MEEFPWLPVLDRKINTVLCEMRNGLSIRNKIPASLCLTQDTVCLGLVHGDDPERCYGEGGGRGVHVWERM